MVESAICSSSKETSATRSIDSRVVPAVRPNDEIVSARTTRRSKKYKNERVSEVAKVIGSSSLKADSREAANTTFPTISGRFSLFKWFKRGSQDSASSWDYQHRQGQRCLSGIVGSRRRASSDNEIQRDTVIETSSDESSNTLYGTSTVRSFAFLTGTTRSNVTEVNVSAGDFTEQEKRHFVEATTTKTTRTVGPFGTGASRIIIGIKDKVTPADVTKTLPAGISSRKRDLTVRYSLQSCNASCGGFGSCENFVDQPERLVERTRLPNARRGGALRVLHVRGKRRAPNPPTEQATRTRRNEEEEQKEARKNGRKCGRRKRRQAPEPPNRSWEKSRISKSLTRCEKSGSASFSAIEDTGSVVFSTKEDTRSDDSREKEETGNADLRAKKESASADLRAKEEIGSADLRCKEETGSADLRSKEETESCVLKGTQETGSSYVLAKEVTGSAYLVTKVVTGSAKLTAKGTNKSPGALKKYEAVSLAVTDKREPANANLSTKEVTGSAYLKVKGQTRSWNILKTEEIGSGHSMNKRETESPNLLKKEEAIRSGTITDKRETRSSSLSTQEETGSANLTAKGKTAIPNLLKSEKNGSGLIKDKRETCTYLSTKETSRSANLRANRKSGSPNLLKKEESGSSFVTAKDETRSDVLTDRQATGSAKEETGSAASRVEENTPNVNLLEKERFASTKVISIGKANIVNKASETFDKEDKRVKTENSAFSRSSSENDNAINLISGNSSTKHVAEETTDLDSAGTISNDSLVLQDGVLHSKRETNTCVTITTTLDNPRVSTSISRSKGRISITTGSQTSTAAMPRPWYKRSVFEHSRDNGTSRRSDVLRNPVQPEVRDDVPTEQATNTNATARKNIDAQKNQDGGTISRLNFFHRNEKSSDERKKEVKRKSGLSILANISQLDKEAAAIVQDKQERTRAASVFFQASKSYEDKNRSEETEDVIQEIVNSSMETSPRRGTRALISKFNAIGNITRVTVNASFFAKNSSSGESRMEKNDITKTFRENDDRSKVSKNENVRGDRDLSQYFLSPQKVVQSDKKNDEIAQSSGQIGTKNVDHNVSARLSFFRDISEIKNLETENPENLTNIFHNIEETRNFKKSPKFSRFHGDVSCDGTAGSSKNDFHERSRKNLIEDEANGQVNENYAKKNCKMEEKEFSNKRMNEKLSTKEYCEKNVKIPDSSESNRVSRVLDIFVEAEQNDRRETNNFSKSIDDEKMFEKGNNVKSEISSVSGRNSEIPIKTDLREMLKEMKHSLPKRLKTKRICERKIVTKNRHYDERTDFFSSTNSEKTSLLSPVMSAYPPAVKISGIFEKSDKNIFPLTEEGGNYERQKVSSAAQTCGNLRRLTGGTESSRGEFSKWRDENVVYRTSGRGIAKPGTSSLTKNKFQLMRPREFARIEAIKTMKNLYGENSYANVEKQQLVYVNASVQGMHIKLPELLRKDGTKRCFEEKKKVHDLGDEIFEIETTAPDSRIVEPQNMNTLAVNRLLRKLEAAIASGHHQQAAGLAKELARLKIHCSVVRQRTKAKDAINVNMYIEDKLAHQGPIPLRLVRSMTVAQLKAKVFTEFEIPTNVQRWIVGKNLADDDSTTLEELQAVEGSHVFLYLVAPELKIDETPLRDEKLVLAEKEPQNDPEHKTIDDIFKLVELDESQIINEEDEEECISEELRMERYEALISLENCDVIPNSEPIDCPICFVTYGSQEGVILRDCLHMFCRPCIANTIHYCEEAEVKCPFRDTEYTCESTLQEREIKALVEPEVYQQHLAKSIAQAENNAGNNAFHCKTPDCRGWCIYDDDVNNFLCPVCGVNNCLTCQVVHTRKNCRQYQEELRLSKETDQESERTAAMLEEMVDRGEALPCPTCAVVLMKKWGCDWLRCSMCKTEICWVTRGPRWGPGGKGDTSGGCRCGERGVKCHPRCNYCH